MKYSQSSSAKYAPLTRPVRTALSGVTCGTAPREVTGKKAGVATGVRPGMASVPSRGTAERPNVSSAATAFPMPLPTEDAAVLRMRNSGGGMLSSSGDAEEREEGSCGSGVADDMAPPRWWGGKERRVEGVFVPRKADCRS